MTAAQEAETLRLESVVASTQSLIRGAAIVLNLGDDTSDVKTMAYANLCVVTCLLEAAADLERVEADLMALRRAK